MTSLDQVCLVSFIRYKDVFRYLQGASKYEQYLDDLDFGNTDPPMPAAKVMLVK